MPEDYIDGVLRQWHAARPGLDVAAYGVVNRVLRLARLFEAELDAVVTRHGLSTKGDFDTLAALRRQVPLPELSPTRLAEAAVITTSGMTSRLDRLESRGFVARHSDPTDRRALLVRLTESGRKVVDEVLEESLETQRRLLGPLGELDRERLAGLLRTLLIGLEVN